MKTKIFLILITLFLITSCEKRERTNPFDSGVPKELWTPYNFFWSMEGSTLKLTWHQPIPLISGFKITKKVGDAAESSLLNLPKDANQLLDAELTGGKLHVYTLVAYAGNYQSNPVTLQVIPHLTAKLTTTDATALTANSAILGGTVTTDGGATITEQGICWATSTGPTTASSKLAIGTGTGTFSNTVTGLLPATLYYFRAYAINSVGTAYGNEVTAATTGFNPDLSYGTLTDNDGNIYKTITIGSQTWMAENLRTTKYRNGDPIPNVTVDATWVALTTGAYCWYNNDDFAYKTTYGALYNWYAVADSRNIAPTGWHVPTYVDWTTLTDYLGGESIAGGQLKETGTLNWKTPNTGATNSSGFTALPSGVRYSIVYTFGTFGNAGGYSSWWSSTADGANRANGRELNYNSLNAGRGSYLNQIGIAVRCVKD